MAGGFVIGGSVLLVLIVFDTITGLHSVQMREEVDKVLTTPTGQGLGLSVNEALSAMRVGLMIAAACAAATAVLGFYALQRNRAARLALSILAVPILLTAPLTGGLMGALVAAAILMLWSGPARDWFAGRPVRQLEAAGPTSPADPSSRRLWEQTRPTPDEHRGGTGEDAPLAGPDGEPRDRSQYPDTPPASSLSTTGSSTVPVATRGFGDPRTPTTAAPQPAWLPPAYAATAPVTSRPVGVTIACVVTWVFSGLVALLYTGMLVALVAAQDRIVRFVVDSPEWQRANLDQGVLVPVLWVGCLLFLGWALAACLLAWFVWRRQNWARYLLMVSAAVAIVAGFFAFPVGVLHQLAAVLTIVGLFSAPARAWFEHRTGSAGPQSQPPAGPPAGPSAGSRDWAPPSADSYPGGPPAQGPGQVPESGGRPPVW
jgi:hypothetical protein